jgi:hypothetical protein
MRTIEHLFAVTLVLFLGARDASATPTFVGPGSCSSSNCHGNNKPLNSSNVLQNEYTTWSKHDHHSRAYLNLLNSDSKKIASNLGIPDAAREPLCLTCHSTYVKESNRNDTFKIEDGVTCESCHGAASDWLKSHTSSEATHADNVKNGMTDIAELGTRSTLCLSCHFGSDDKTVNHKLYGAGHPRLSFELDTFGVLQPKHWVIDSDYEKRKGPYVPLKAWLTGQLHHAQATLEVLESPTRSMSGLYPELSLFDCFSCHHSLTEDQWKKRSYGGNPGELKLNLPSLYILKEVTTALDAALGRELTQNLETLHNSYRADRAPTTIDTLQSLLADRVSPLVERTPADLSNTTHVLGTLTSYAASHPYPTFELAEQIAMGIQATIASSPELALRYDTQLKDLFSTLKSSETFGAEKFTRAATRLNQSVTRKD